MTPEFALLAILAILVEFAALLYFLVRDEESHRIIPFYSALLAVFAVAWLVIEVKNR